MRRENFRNNIAAGLAGFAIGILTPYFFSKDAPQSNNSPRFRNAIGEYIGFSDDYARGLRAVFFYNGKTIETESSNSSPCFANVKIPQEILTNKEPFYIVAKDIDENRSHIYSGRFEENGKVRISE